MTVPAPTEKDLSLVKLGFATWYEYDNDIVVDKETDKWKQSVLALIRLANFYKKQLDELNK